MFRRKQTEELSDDYPTEDFSDKSDTKIAVRTAIEKLDEQHREIIVMRYIAELSVNETAEALDISRFALISALTLISGKFTPVGIANSAIYILTPFLLVNGISLAIFSCFKGTESGYISCGASVFVSVCGILLQGSQVKIPENICNNFCIRPYIFTPVFAMAAAVIFGVSAYGVFRKRQVN